MSANDRVDLRMRQYADRVDWGVVLLVITLVLLVVTLSLLSVLKFPDSFLSRESCNATRFDALANLLLAHHLLVSYCITFIICACEW